MPYKTRVYPKVENGFSLVRNPRTEGFFVSAAVSGGGTRDEAVGMSTWEANPCVVPIHVSDKTFEITREGLG